jgi:hypothetical protein
MGGHFCLSDKLLVSDIIFVNGHGVNLILLKQRFLAGGYQLQKTAHFLLFTRSEAPPTILVHWFDPEILMLM